MNNILIALFLLTLFICKGCKNIGATPEKYKYKVGVSEIKYSNDTSVVRSILVEMLHKKITPFSSNIYDNETYLFVDSLVYGPDQLRMIALVIARNPASKKLMRKNDSTYYYDAYYLFCSKGAVEESISIYNRAEYGLINFSSYKKISETLREYCFSRLLDTDEGIQHYNYNIDDIRFWSSEKFEVVVKNAIATKIRVDSSYSYE